MLGAQPYIYPYLAQIIGGPLGDSIPEYTRLPNISLPKNEVPLIRILLETQGPQTIEP